jgi:DNA-binding MarR family transcriptional regulator
MPPKNLSDDLKDFIVLCIPSVTFLEAVLLMRIGHQKSWDRRSLAGALYLDEPMAERLLDALERAETAVVCNAASRQYRYQPLSDLFRQRIDQLAGVYSENLVGITKLIHRRIALDHAS